MDIVYGQIETTDDSGKVAFTKKKVDKKKLLKKAEIFEEKLKSMDETEAEKLRTGKAVKTALLRAQGIKVLDDKALLKKALKREEKKRQKSTAQWYVVFSFFCFYSFFLPLVPFVIPYPFSLATHTGLFISTTTGETAKRLWMMPSKSRSTGELKTCRNASTIRRREKSPRERKSPSTKVSSIAVSCPSPSSHAPMYERVFSPTKVC